MTLHRTACLLALVWLSACSDKNAPDTGIVAVPGAFPTLAPIDSVIAAGQVTYVTPQEINQTRAAGAATAARAEELRNRPLN